MFPNYVRSKKLNGMKMQHYSYCFCNVLGFQTTHFYLKRRNLIAEDECKKNKKYRIAVHGADLSTFHPFILQRWVVYWFNY